MNAIRKIQDVGSDRYLHVLVPRSMGQRVEIIVLSLNEAEARQIEAASEDDARYFDWDADSHEEGRVHAAATAATITEWRDAAEDEVWK